MGAPEVEHESFMTLSLMLRRIPIGETPYGTRVEVPFEGTATSTLWDGERAVYGIDHITLSTTGTSCIDVHVIISGDDGAALHRPLIRHGATALAISLALLFGFFVLPPMQDILRRGSVDDTSRIAPLFLISSILAAASTAVSAIATEHRRT
jgi:Protein of unknown function (DUF3237)